MPNGLSIILPTYTGVETIADTLQSIGSQIKEANFELVILQDGPNQDLAKAVKNALSKIDFGQTKVNYKILPKNQGRFQARLEAAKIAQNGQLLFVDDRVQLAPDFFAKLKKIKTDLLIGNVIEKTDTKTNLISSTLFFIRHQIYGSGFGADFKDYYIAEDNFESSPKGTASLFINRKLFIEVCEEAAKRKAGAANRFFNEDIGIMRALIDKGHKILRTSQLKIYYQPRTSLKEAFWHLYDRGPRFVDYYLKPRSRFFPVLAACYLFSVAVLLVFVLVPQSMGYILLGLLTADLTAAFILGRGFKNAPKLALGLPLVALVFLAGVYRGTLIKAKIIGRN